MRYALMVAAFVGAGSCWGAAASAQTKGPEYDAVTDFSLNSNPNGPWTYFHFAIHQNAPFDTPDADFKQVAGLHAWTNGKAGKAAPYIAMNATSKPIHFETIVLSKNELLMNSGPIGSGLFFTVPVHGVYRFKLQIEGVDKRQVNTSYEFFAKGQQLCSGAVISYREKHYCSATLTLKAGDQFQFGAFPAHQEDQLRANIGVILRIKGPV